VILEKGGRIVQQGAPAEILAAPASDFVASFVGADHGKRRLRTRVVEGRTVVIDADGRPAGVLEDAGGA
jgi:osmoprotectant transport system ATP-binding protein